MKRSTLRYFTIILIILFCFHLYSVVHRGFEYPFDSVGDFFKKLIITLGFSLPVYLVVSAIGGILLGLIFKKEKHRHD